MSVPFPPISAPLSETREEKWRPFTNTAVFTSVRPTEGFPGRVKVEIQQTSKEKNPCSFLDLFKSFANMQTVDRLMKCRVDDSNVPVLEIDSKGGPASFPVNSAKVTRRYFDESSASDEADLEIGSNGAHYSFFASAKRIDFYRVVKRPWSFSLYKHIDSF